MVVAAKKRGEGEAGSEFSYQKRSRNWFILTIAWTNAKKKTNESARRTFQAVGAVSGNRVRQESLLSYFIKEATGFGPAYQWALKHRENHKNKPTEAVARMGKKQKKEILWDGGGIHTWEDHAMNKPKQGSRHRPLRTATGHSPPQTPQKNSPDSRLKPHSPQ